MLSSGRLWEAVASPCFPGVTAPGEQLEAFWTRRWKLSWKRTLKSPAMAASPLKSGCGFWPPDASSGGRELTCGPSGILTGQSTGQGAKPCLGMYGLKWSRNLYGSSPPLSFLSLPTPHSPCSSKTKQNKKRNHILLLEFRNSSGLLCCMVFPSIPSLPRCFPIYSSLPKRNPRLAVKTLGNW